MEPLHKLPEYWDNYLLSKFGKSDVQTEADLYFQVGRTVQKKPIERETFEYIVNEMVQGLSLEMGDVLVDFCCGNGLFTYELREKVDRIFGVDFSEHMIKTANQMKGADNITYCLNDVIGFLKSFPELFPGVKPNKYLTNESLAYFTPADLEEMLTLIKGISGNNFHFLLRGTPNADLMWNFYNTEERKQRYYENVAKGDLTNDGLGQWWKPTDIEAICKKLHLSYAMRNQDTRISDFRMDVLIGG